MIRFITLMLLGMMLHAQNGQVQINVSNLTPEWGGILRLGLYDQENFPVEGKALFQVEKAVRTLEDTIILDDIPPGVYAVALY